MALVLMLPGSPEPWTLPTDMTSLEFQTAWQVAREEGKQMTVQLTSPDVSGITELIVWPAEIPWYAVSED